MGSPESRRAQQSSSSEMCVQFEGFIDRESGELWVTLLKSKDEWVSEASRVLNQVRNKLAELRLLKAHASASAGLQLISSTTRASGASLRLITRATSGSTGSTTPTPPATTTRPAY